MSKSTDAPTVDPAYDVASLEHFYKVALRQYKEAGAIAFGTEGSSDARRQYAEKKAAYHAAGDKLRAAKQAMKKR